MTTRRRRAGSESFVEELLVPETSAAQSSFQGQICPNSTQSSYAILPQVVNAVNGSLQWGSSSPVNVSSDQAYYKKTDNFNPATVVQEITGTVKSGVNQPWPSNVSYWNPGHTQNSGYATHTDQYTSGAAVGVCGTQNPWSGSGVSKQTDQLSSVGAHWNYSGSNSVSQWSPESSYLHNADDSDMASRDRTQEFVRIVRSQQGSQTNGVLPHQDGKRPRDLRQYTEFMQRSKLIGRNISSTYAKLEKLTHLAKKRSLFDDSQDREVQELTGIIRHDLTSLTKQLADLRSQSRVASPNGTSAHLQKHSSNLVGSLQTKVAFITQKFKDVLEVRTENLKKQAERRDHFTGGAVSGELPPGAVAGHHQGSVLVADEAAAYNTNIEPNRSNGEVAINLGSGGAYHQQLQLMEEQDTYLQNRADTMRTIESTIVELGQMFTQLASMVKEQEELVHRIDANVEDAELNVEAAHSELLKYFKSVSSNRMLMIKVFGIMIVFFVIFVIFMA